MGRWAQSKRRGGAASPAVPSGPPPAPTLDASSGCLLQTATGNNDAGGEVTLENSLTGLDPWENLDGDAWSRVKNYGAIEGFAAYFFRSYEVGNGVAYEGQSAYSNIVDLT